METTDERSPPQRGERVERLEFTVEWPPNHAAAYLIDGPTGERVLVDAGPPGEQATETMRTQLKGLGVALEAIDAVVITHPHSDHIGQVPALRTADVTVYAPAPALEQVRRDADDLAARVRETTRSAGYENDALEREVERARHSLERNRRLLDPDDAIGFSFEDSFRVGGLEFEPIHTPGHQVHHASLAASIGGKRVLFSGDALIEPFRAGALHVGLDDGAYEAVEAFGAGLGRLENEAAARSFERVFPGHGPVFTDAAAALADTRADLESLLASRRDAVAAVGPATPLEITEHLYGDLQYPAQLLDTLGALGTLAERGEVAFDWCDGVRYYRAVDGSAALDQ
ncbi:beta-lactamase [Natrialba hulunbeirensis JCM 10989]|uniref:Beta-lactamase n=1 Tax=Natrialba hulunbeirensis JCM 10989 TaxID=1227493 RepID=L9ZRV1_9EURY|nr:MBL fold metallo-hydrolase [Natrialba hulunbeirensis]ELY87878.1 beta-lactamase [Natrialba hulunbeirensis JCM 10989]